MSNKKIVLVNPNNRGNYVQGTYFRENLGLCYLASSLREAGFKVTIIDSRIEGDTIHSLASKINKINPFLVGFSVIAKDGISWCEKTTNLFKKITKSTPHVCLGNYFPTLQPRRALESMPSANSVIVGEGEITLKNLAKNLFYGKEWRKLLGIAYRRKNKIVINRRRKLIKNINNLPIPDHYGFKYNLSEFAIEGSRGCYRACSFCSISPFINAQTIKEKWRFRSAKNILNEIQMVSKKFPQIKTFRFVDPDFIGSVQHLNRIEEFISGLKKRKLKINFIIDTRTEIVNSIPRKIWQRLREVGLEEVYIGVETVSLKVKRMMFKLSNTDEDIAAISLLNSLNIKTRFGFMMFTPWSTVEDLIANAKFLRNFGFSRLDKYFQEMYLVPGTNAVNLVKKNSKIWFDYEGEYYSYELPSILNKTREICRLLVKTCPNFFSQAQSLHEEVRKNEVNKENMKRTISRINNFHYNFFIEVLKNAKESVNVAKSKPTLEEYAEKIINKYQSRLNILKKEVDRLKLDSN